MSNKLTPNLDEILLDKELVRDYLLEHPEFFAEYPELITQIQIPHHTHGAISLLEKREEIQRGKIVRMEEELSLLMGYARQNELIFRAISEMYYALVACPSIIELERRIDAICREQLLLAQFRLLQPEDQAYLHLQAKLDGRDVYLGRLPEDLMNAVFMPGARSVALVELNYEYDQDESIFGIAAFASSSAEHFQPTMDTMFIRELGRLMTRHAVHILTE